MPTPPRPCPRKRKIHGDDIGTQRQQQRSLPRFVVALQQSRLVLRPELDVGQYVYEAEVSEAGEGLPADLEVHRLQGGRPQDAPISLFIRSAYEWGSSVECYIVCLGCTNSPSYPSRPYQLNQSKLLRCHVEIVRSVLLRCRQQQHQDFSPSILHIIAKESLVLSKDEQLEIPHFRPIKGLFSSNPAVDIDQRYLAMFEA